MKSNNHGERGLLIDDNDDRSSWNGSYGEARGDFEGARDATGLNSVNSDSGEDEVFVEGGVGAGSERRNRLECWHGVVLFRREP